MAYGTVFDKATASNYLREANRDIYGRKTWDSLYGSVEASANRAMEQYTYDYSTAMNEAYAASLGERSTVFGSNLSQGSKSEAVSSIDTALEQAYQTYYRNYLENTEAIQKSASEQLGLIAGEQETQATNLAAMYETFYPYLEKVYESQSDLEDQTKNIFSTEYAWKKYITPEGNLVTSNELRKMMYDEEGNLTEQGSNIYEQLMSELGTRYGEDYDYFKFLFDTNPELYEWATQQNYYDYAPDRTGVSTNLSSFRTSLGLPADFGSYTQPVLPSNFEGDYKKLVRNLNWKGSNSDYVNSTIGSYYDDLLSVAEHYGVEDKFVSKYGNEKDFKSYIVTNYASTDAESQGWQKEAKNIKNANKRQQFEIEHRVEDAKNYLMNLISNKNAKM